MKRSTIVTGIVICAALLISAVLIAPAVAGKDGHGGGHGYHKEGHRKCGSANWHGISEAVAVIHPTQGNTAKGVVRLIKTCKAVKVIADIEGLSPNSKHAIHVHQYGDTTGPHGKSAGGHYNPRGNPHALPSHDVRHAGDLGNLTADAQGKAHYEILVDNLSIAGYKNPVIGRGIVIHAKADDGGQPTGNAGSRIGYGVIGIAKSSAPATQPSR